MRILVATSSVFRQRLYSQAIENLGHAATITSGGLECAGELRAARPDVLILEAPLTWGGAVGVLEIAQREMGDVRIPVILVALGMGSIDWFQLSRYRIDDILFRVPTVRELERAIAGVAEQPAGAPSQSHADGNHPLQPPHQPGESGRAAGQQPHWHNTGSHSIGHSW